MSGQQNESVLDWQGTTRSHGTESATGDGDVEETVITVLGHIHLVLSLLGVTTNGVILLLFLTDHVLRAQRQLTIFMPLAISDAMFCAVGFVERLVPFLAVDEPKIVLICTIVVKIGPVAAHASRFLILYIATERLIHLVFNPDVLFFYANARRRAVIATVVVFSLSLSEELSTFFAAEGTDQKIAHLVCPHVTVPLLKTQVFAAVTFVSLVLLVAVHIIFQCVYRRTLAALKEARREAAREFAMIQKTDDTNNDGAQTAWQNFQNLKKKKQLNRMIGLALLVTLVCYGTTALLFGAFIVAPHYFVSYQKLIFSISLVLLTVNCIVNLFVYYIQCQDFQLSAGKTAVKIVKIARKCKKLLKCNNNQVETVPEGQ